MIHSKVEAVYRLHDALEAERDIHTAKTLDLLGQSEFIDEVIDLGARQSAKKDLTSFTDDAMREIEVMMEQLHKIFIEKTYLSAEEGFLLASKLGKARTALANVYSYLNDLKHTIPL